MGILTSRISLRRYRLSPITHSNDALLAGLANHVFRADPRRRTTQPNIGWVPVAQPDSTIESPYDFAFGDLVVFGVRADSKRVDSTFLKMKLHERCLEVMDERGLTRLSRQHKAELKEALQEELLGAALPTISLCEVIWRPTRGEVWITNTQEVTNEIVRGLFEDSFGLSLYPDRQFDWLLANKGPEAIEREVATWWPQGSAAGGLAGEVSADGWHGNDPWEGSEPQLGEFFLEWLLYAEGTRYGVLNHNPPVMFWTGTKAVLRLTEQKGDRTILEGEGSKVIRQAVSMLIDGMAPCQLRVNFRKEEMEWEADIKAGYRGIQVARLRVPSSGIGRPIEADMEAHLLERVYLVEQFYELLAGAFQQFWQEYCVETYANAFTEWCLGAADEGQAPDPGNDGIQPAR